jgi:hypothetical protein
MSSFSPERIFAAPPRVARTVLTLPQQKPTVPLRVLLVICLMMKKEHKMKTNKRVRDLRRKGKSILVYISKDGISHNVRRIAKNA